jgi:two-component system CheB/CheR fusion protein
VDLPGEIEPLQEKVLIVDDNADAADSLATLFRLAGYQVQVAYDGLSGVTMATAFEPGVVLLDIGLPGLDGYAVARRLRDQDATRNSLLIAVSGYGQARDEARSAQAGFDRHLVKPVEFTRLQAALQSDRRAVAAEFGR